MQIKNKLMEHKEIIIVMLIALFARLIFVPYFNMMDIVTHHLQWTKEINNGGLFFVYNSNWVDYPPIFLIVLYFLKDAILFAVNENNRLLFMFLFKIVPIVVDCIIVYVLYKNYGKKISLLWAINIGAIINSGMFGQTDSFLCLFILLMIISIKKNDCWKATLYFTLGCLTKLQMCYLAPLYLVYILIINKESFNKKILYLLSGATFGYLFWLPWIIGIKDFLLPFRIYFDGFNKYGSINLNALNITYSTKYISEPMSLYTILGVELSTINMLLYILIISISIYLLYKIKNFELVSAFYLFSIYMLTFSQHERYTMSFLIVCLICYGSFNDKKILISYNLCAFTTGVIEFCILLLVNLAIENVISLNFYYFNVVNYLRPFVILNIVSYLLIIIYIWRFAKDARKVKK